MTFSANTVSLVKAAKILDKSYPTVRKLVAQGFIRTVKIGTRSEVLMSELERFKKFGNWIHETQEPPELSDNPPPPSSKISDVIQKDDRTLPSLEETNKGPTYGIVPLGSKPLQQGSKRMVPAIPPTDVEREDSFYPDYLKGLKDDK